MSSNCRAVDSESGEWGCPYVNNGGNLFFPSGQKVGEEVFVPSMQCSTLALYTSAVQCSRVEYSEVQCIAVQSKVGCSAVQCSAV